MDWQGQKRVESVMQILLIIFAGAALIAGYTLGSFQTMIVVYAAGFLLTALVTVPNWPFFNRSPLKWLDPSEADRHPRPPPPPVTAGKKKGGRK